MSFALPTIRIGEPKRHKSLSVFPLYVDSQGAVSYRLAHAALADESLLVEEVDESGSVPELMVENKGDQRVLFLEGEELEGAKQNRILNTSVLVPAHSKVRIPVSCVEQGRWRYKSRKFQSSGGHSPSKLRRALKASVSRSVRARRSHRSDQGAVWAEVDAVQLAHGVTSETAAMSDAFQAKKDAIDSFHKQLNYVENASGLAVAVGSRIESVDLFDKPETCAQVWQRLLSGLVMDALVEGDQESQAETSDVVQLLSNAEQFAWAKVAAVGEGDEYRAESEAGDHGSALSVENVVIHGSVVTAV